MSLYGLFGIDKITSKITYSTFKQINIILTSCVVTWKTQSISCSQYLHYPSPMPNTIQISTLVIKYAHMFTIMLKWPHINTKKVQRTRGMSHEKLELQSIYLTYNYYFSMLINCFRVYNKYQRKYLAKINYENRLWFACLMERFFRWLQLLTK